MGRWKRSDIPTRTVLRAFKFGRPRVDRFLAHVTGAPEKVVWAAMQRESGRGFVDYGTRLSGGWLTPEGEAELLRIEASHG